MHENLCRPGIFAFEDWFLVSRNKVVDDTDPAKETLKYTFFRKTAHNTKGQVGIILNDRLLMTGIGNHHNII